MLLKIPGEEPEEGDEMVALVAICGFFSVSPVLPIRLS